VCFYVCVRVCVVRLCLGAITHPNPTLSVAQEAGGFCVKHGCYCRVDLFARIRTHLLSNAEGAAQVPTACSAFGLISGLAASPPQTTPCCCLQPACSVRCPPVPRSTHAALAPLCAPAAG